MSPNIVKGKIKKWKSCCLRRPNKHFQNQGSFPSVFRLFASLLIHIQSAVELELGNKRTSSAWFCKETDARWHCWLT
jgi:prophage maintenance system killer protein